ncbi:uncharacterized protein [Takifugu rubripes]|uniref:uncharacterized protein n=1 Tax=Takifugu rubripes TaxID=31033 RepID=UPI001145221C|nr:uncharacterized protein LOC115251453 [Takifugu rubripes]
MQQEQTEEIEKVEKGYPASSREEDEYEEEIKRPGAEEVQKRVKVCEEKEEEKKKTGDEGAGGDPASDPKSSVSVEEQEKSKRPELLDRATRGQDPIPQIQRCQPTTGGAQISRWDKTIIEKIRSYYEAAAKAEERDDEEEELGEGTSLRRRNSFSEIPSGLVKESVSQFDVGDRQWEEQTHTQSPRWGSHLAPCSPEKADQPLSSLDLGAGAPSGVTQDQEDPNHRGPVSKEAEISDRHDGVCNKPPNDGPRDEEEEKEKSSQGEEPTTSHDKCNNEASPGNPDVVNVHEPIQAPATETHGSDKEPSREPVAHREIGQRTGNTTDSLWTRNSDKDLANSHRSPSSPTHKKTGRWSHHSRIASANRVLFEAMGSDVAGIGLFEASPVVDPVLIENSARILSRVQTLALMYSAKAGTMKVPLHQKQGDVAMKPLMSLNRPSEPQNKSPPEHQLYSEDKMESHMVTKVEPQTTALTLQQTQTQHQTQNQTKANCKGQAWDQTPPEKKIGGTESYVKESRKRVPCESLMSSEVWTPVGQQQTGTFTLSRPRDFISALNRGSSRESSCCSTGDSRTSAQSPRVQSPSRTQRECCHSKSDLQTQLELQSAPASAVDSRFRGHSEGLHRGNGQIYADTEETAGGARSQLTDKPLQYPECITQPETPNLSLHGDRPSLWESHKEQHEMSKRDTKQSTATRSKAEETSPVELVLIVAPPESQNPPDPLLGQYHEQHQKNALQLEGAIKISGTSKEMDGLHENAGGGWSQMSELHQSRSVDLLPTFTIPRPVDPPATVAAQAPANASRCTSEQRKTDRQVSSSNLPSLGHRPFTTKDQIVNPSAVRPLLRDCTTSPVGDDQSSFVQGPPCSSLCAIGPVGSLVTEKTSLNLVSRALPSFSPTFSSKAVSVQANSASPPAPSAFRPPSTCFRRSPSITAGPASSPTPNSSPCHPCSPPQLVFSVQ